jgi:hypothetical protein
MIKTEMIEKLVELILISGFVKDNQAPLSLILIAEAESGKTKIIQSLNCPRTLETSDLSAKAISEIILPKIDNDKEGITHIIIPDFIKVLAHKSVVVQSTMAFLNALMEEGIEQQLFYGSVFKLSKNRKCGLLTSVTSDYYFKSFRSWHEIGFTSRFIHCSFEYSNETIQEIHKAIKENKTFDEYRKMKKITPKVIEIPNEIANKLNIIIQETLNNQRENKIRIRVKGGKQQYITLGNYGFRLHKQMRKLLKAIALKNHRTKVNWSDLDNELIPLLDYIRLPKNPKVL